MRKRLLLYLLAAIALGGFIASRAYADPGDPCITADGRSGYIYASGENGEEVCVPVGGGQ